MDALAMKASKRNKKTKIAVPVKAAAPRSSDWSLSRICDLARLADLAARFWEWISSLFES
jgi:hypothetical protein